MTSAHGVRISASSSFTSRSSSRLWVIRDALLDWLILGLFHESGWRRYTPADFHRLTLEHCGLPVLEAP